MVRGGRIVATRRRCDDINDDLAFSVFLFALGRCIIQVNYLNDTALIVAGIFMHVINKAKPLINESITFAGTWRQSSVGLH